MQTTVSDDEIYHQDRPAKFYTLRYEPFLVGTSRPETKLGDTAVAVHPGDERYAEHVGKTYDVEWPSGPTITVRVVADAAVDPETGAGAVSSWPGRCSRAPRSSSSTRASAPSIPRAWDGRSKLPWHGHRR